MLQEGVARGLTARTKQADLNKTVVKWRRHRHRTSPCHAGHDLNHPSRGVNMSEKLSVSLNYYHDLKENRSATANPGVRHPTASLDRAFYIASYVKPNTTLDYAVAFMRYHTKTVITRCLPPSSLKGTVTFKTRRFHAKNSQILTSTNLHRC